MTLNITSNHLETVHWPQLPAMWAAASKLNYILHRIEIDKLIMK